MMGNQFEKFKRTNLSEGELREAVESLGAVVEPASFWSAIANDASMSVAHRKLALVQLVRRHVVPGTTTVGVFAEMLEGAHWLSDGDVTVVTAIGGKVPVTWSPDDTVVAIALPGGRGAIYLAMAGRFAPEEIALALRGVSHDERVRSAVIRDAGLEVGWESKTIAL
jgi:hypothetical protein